MPIFKKTLKKTDIEKRLSIPTTKKQCFLDFKGKDKVNFRAMDKNGKVWSFVCSRRKMKEEMSYPKPVLSKGWLQFVSEWKLAIFDEVILDHHEDGKGLYRIHVIKGAKQPSAVISTQVQNHTADRTMGTAGYSNLAATESAITNSTGQGVTYNKAKSSSEKSQTSADRIGSLGPHMQPKEPISSSNSIVSGLKLANLSRSRHEQFNKPICVNFFALALQDRGEKKQPTFPIISHMVECPTKGSKIPYFEFL